MEALGLQLAGTSFVNPGTLLRGELTKESVRKLLDQTSKGSNYRPMAEVVTEKSMVNAMVMMMTTGGSTNLTLHLIAMAAAAGIQINWQDMDDISRITPLLANVYPNGQADVNHFEQAGGLAYLVNQLRSINMLNEDVVNVMGEGLDAYTRKPQIDADRNISWGEPVVENGDNTIVASAAAPFAAEGGMRTVNGNLGTGVVKISAVDKQYQIIEAPCKIFDTQDSLKAAFEAGDLSCDHVAVVRFQGPAANGMPELHKLTPYLGILQDRGFNVALVTDGRMSGASGKVLTAMHVSPEAKKGGMLAYLKEGDVIRVNCHTGELCTLVSEAELSMREPAAEPKILQTLGRGLFAKMRDVVGESTLGASFISK
jgi:phosphogluconate dehydratase